jgi:hypothetical protein
VWAGILRADTEGNSARAISLSGAGTAEYEKTQWVGADGELIGR